MLENIRPFLRSDVSQMFTFTDWKEFCRSIQTHKERCQHRYASLNNIPLTRGVQLLKHILEIASPEQLAKFGDNFYIYNTQVFNILDNCQPLFEKYRSGKAYHKTFAYCQEEPSLPEYIITDLDNIFLKTLPLHLTTARDWDHIQPLELVWYDDIEQTFDMYSTSMLRFHQSTPRYVFWVLNIPALILKAVQHVRSNTYFSVESFIQKDVFLHIILQSYNIWLMKLQQQVLDTFYTGGTISDIKNNYPQSQTQFSYIGSRLPYVLDELHDIYTKVQNGTILAKNVFSCPFYPDKDNKFVDSFVSRCEYILKNCDVSSNIRHKHLLMIRDIPYLDYFIKVICLNKTHPVMKSLITQLKIIVYRWKTTTPLSSIASHAHANYIRNKLSTWEYILST